MLNRAVIDGRLECTGATLLCEHPTPLNPRGTVPEAYSATVRAGMHLGRVLSSIFLLSFTRLARSA